MDSKHVQENDTDTKVFESHTYFISKRSVQCADFNWKYTIALDGMMNQSQHIAIIMNVQSVHKYLVEFRTYKANNYIEKWADLV